MLNSLNAALSSKAQTGSLPLQLISASPPRAAPLPSGHTNSQRRSFPGLEHCNHAPVMQAGVVHRGGCWEVSACLGKAPQKGDSSARDVFCSAHTIMSPSPWVENIEVTGGDGEMGGEQLVSGNKSVANSDPKPFASMMLAHGVLKI